MNVLVCTTHKEQFSTDAEAQRSIKRRYLKFPLYTYTCVLCGDIHLTRQKPRHRQGVRNVNEPMTNAERKHLTRKLEDVGRQLVNEADKYNRAVARRQAAEIREHQRRMAEQALLDRVHAERISDLQETLEMANVMSRRDFTNNRQSIA
jgi:hypothetical protein